jgi:nitrite reductase (NO-forming)
MNRGENRRQGPSSFADGPYGCTPVPLTDELTGLLPSRVFIIKLVIMILMPLEGRRAPPAAMMSADLHGGTGRSRPAFAVSGRTNRGGRAGQRRPRIARHAAAGALVTAYLLAAAVVVIAHGMVAVPEWLALHLLVLGAATNAVFVWSRFFAQALLHARPGPERPAHVRLGVLNTGVAAVLAGVCGDVPSLAVAGAAVVVVAVAAHAVSLVAMVRSSPLAGPLRIVGWYYVAAGAALAVGGTLGGALAAGWVGSARVAGTFVLAHAQVNLLGWLGLAIIGTQFMLWPMVLRTRMSEDAPRAARRVLVLTAGGLAVTTAALLVAPWLSGAQWLAAGGMACYLAGAVAALVPAVREMRAKPPRTAAAWALLAGNGWLIAALAADTAGLAAGPTAAAEVLDRILIPVLGIGVTWQVLTGALTFLLPVTIGGGPAGNRRLTTILERCWHARALLGNGGVLGLVTLPGGWANVAAWTAVLAGFGTFPALAVAALLAGWVRPDRSEPPGQHVRGC